MFRIQQIFVFNYRYDMLYQYITVTVDKYFSIQHTKLNYFNGAKYVLYRRQYSSSAGKKN